MDKLKYISKSEKETLWLAAKVAKALKANDCLALIGDFGAGKTTFVKGLAKALSVGKKDYVSSPSFVILKTYRGKKMIYHFDLYRLKNALDAEAIGLDEFVNAGGISVIEWPDNVLDLLPANRLEIRFMVAGKKKREIYFKTSCLRLDDHLRKVL